MGRPATTAISNKTKHQEQVSFDQSTQQVGRCTPSRPPAGLTLPNAPYPSCLLVIHRVGEYQAGDLALDYSHGTAYLGSVLVITVKYTNDVVSGA